MSDIILNTKLYKPQTRPDIISRSRLIDKLNDGLAQNLTLISAPAGFGKTTLVCEWLEQLSYPSTWISLDQEDNELFRFITYFLKGLQRFFPEFNDSIEDIFYSQQTPPVEIVIDKILQKVTAFPQRIIYVLDDFHVIKNQDVQEFLLYLIQYSLNSSLKSTQAQGIHFVLVSRLDPIFPLSRWRLNKQICDIRSDDLRFSYEETGQFLNQRTKIDFSPEQINAFESRTEGWIAGLQLASFSIQGFSPSKLNQFIRNFTGNNRYIADYLIEEVLEQQTQEIKDFLLQSAILERMNAQLCDALLNRTGSQAILEKLDHSNLFLVSLDDQRGWYRYHQLFSDLLKYRLSIFSSVSIPELHNRAANWLEQNDFLEESLKHWLLAENYAAASELIEKTAADLMSKSKFLLLRSLLDRFPEKAFKEWPWLCIYRAWVNFILQPEVVEVWVEKTNAILSETNLRLNEKQHAELLGNLHSVKAICSARHGDFEESFENARIALAYLEPQNYKVRGLALYAQATAQALKGDDLLSALETCHEAEKILNLGRNYAGQVDALSLSGEISQMLGELNQAAALYKEAIDHSYNKEDDVFFSAAMSYTGLGEVLYEWNQLDQALLLLIKGCELGEQWGISQWISSFCSLTMVYLGMGDLKSAIDVMQQYEQRSTGRSILLVSQSKEVACKIRLLNAIGDFASIEKIIDKRKLHEIRQPNVVQEIEWAALVLFYYSQRKWHDVIRISEQLLQAMVRGKRYGRWIKIAAMCSVAYKMTGNTDSAFSLLMELLPRAKSEGYLRTFVDLGEPMMELLVEYSHLYKASTDLNYVNQILSLLIGQKPTDSAYQFKPTNLSYDYKNTEIRLFDALSEHELKVLRFISLGFSNRDIAEELGVSINTVKTHCANIYGKLGVHNRVLAANRAKLIGILAS